MWPLQSNLFLLVNAFIAKLIWWSSSVYASSVWCGLVANKRQSEVNKYYCYSSINGSLLLKFLSSALKISQKAIEMTSNAVEISHSYNSSIDIGFLAMSAYFASFPLNTSSFIV